MGDYRSERSTCLRPLVIKGVRNTGLKLTKNKRNLLIGNQRTAKERRMGASLQRFNTPTFNQSGQSSIFQ
jgi:hypothetical protein